MHSAITINTRTTLIRSPRPTDGPRPLSAAGGRPQVALRGRRTAPGSSPRPAKGPRSLSTAGGRPQAALHGGGRPHAALHGRRTAPGRSPRRRTASGRSPRPADGPRPLSTAGGRLQAALPVAIFRRNLLQQQCEEDWSCVDHHLYVAS
jgi:hypothetical protein